MAIRSARVCGEIGIALFGCLIVGCNDQQWGQLEGVVTVDGAPVGPGSISLAPVDASQAGAMGSFGEDGRYAIVSAGRKEGARAGEYRVTIHGGEFGTESGQPPAPSKIPRRYGDPSTSDLNVTIEPGRQTFDFDLKS